MRWYTSYLEASVSIVNLTREVDDVAIKMTSKLLSPSFHRTRPVFLSYFLLFILLISTGEYKIHSWRVMG